MSAPNIVNSATITGEIDAINVQTGWANVTVNSAASEKVYKINTLSLANKTANASIETTVDIVLHVGGSDFYLANTMSIPATATLMGITKDMGYYLKEGDAITVRASANSQVDAVCSYEIIDDA